MIGQNDMKSQSGGHFNFSIFHSNSTHADVFTEGLSEEQRRWMFTIHFTDSLHQT